MSARIIVVGNEKGGCGKSTMVMHLIVASLIGGLRVASGDLDARQGTLTRYLANRRIVRKALGINFPMPSHGMFHHLKTLEAHIEQRREEFDVIFLDCPGRDAPISRLAHSYADSLVTPLNDSFLDLDVIAQMEPDGQKIAKLSQYAEMVFGQRKIRAQRDQNEVDWIVVRNRLGFLDAKNNRKMANALDQVGKRVGFRTTPGISERVIYRELFPLGLTVLDLKETTAKPLAMSHLAARQEIRNLRDAILKGGEVTQLD